MKKVYAILAQHFTAREAEGEKLEWDHVKRTVNSDNRVIYEVSSVEHQLRVKRTGTTDPDENPHLVIGATETSILDHYLTCFSIEERTGRFFRKLCVKSGGRYFLFYFC